MKHTPVSWIRGHESCNPCISLSDHGDSRSSVYKLLCKKGSQVSSYCFFTMLDKAVGDRGDDSSLHQITDESCANRKPVWIRQRHPIIAVSTPPPPPVSCTRLWISRDLTLAQSDAPSCRSFTKLTVSVTVSGVERETLVTRVKAEAGSHTPIKLRSTSSATHQVMARYAHVRRPSSEQGN